jgi:hypothetical protein
MNFINIKAFCIIYLKFVDDIENTDTGLLLYIDYNYIFFRSSSNDPLVNVPHSLRVSSGIITIPEQ